MSMQSLPLRPLLTSLVTALLVAGALVAAGPRAEEPPAEDSEVGEGAMAEESAPGLDHEEPYVVAYQFVGVLQCGAGVNAEITGASADLCFAESWTPSGWSPTGHAFEAPAGARMAIVELAWSPTGALQGETLALDSHASLEAEFGSGTAAGPSILRLEIPAADPDGLAEDAQVRVQPTYDVGSGVVMDQRYDLRVTVFVHQEPPEAYTAF